MHFITKWIFDTSTNDPIAEIAVISFLSLIFLGLYFSTIYYYDKIKDVISEEQNTKNDDDADNFKLFTDIGISCCVFGLFLFGPILSRK